MKTEPLSDVLRETLAVFERGGEPLTTTDVADRLDLGRRTVYGRLERLVDRDRLATKKVGANARVWWRPARPGGAADGEPSADERGATSPTGGADVGADGAAARSDGSDVATNGAAAGSSVGASDAGDELDSFVDAVEEYAIFSLDPDGVVRSWNHGAERIKGYEADEIVGEHFSTFYTEADREAGVPDRNLERAAEEGEATDEGWRLRADGTRFWANVVISAIRDDGGTLRGFAKVTRDMSDRRESERRLRRERDLVRQILETVPIGVAVYDADGTPERVDSGGADREFERIRSVEGATVRLDELDLADPDGEPIADDDHPLRRAIEAGEAVEDRLVQYEAADGGTRWVSLSVTPMLDELGDVDRVVVAGTDVTALKRKERRLERRRDELESELEEVFARVDDAFFALDEEFRFTHVNDRAAEVMRTEPGELIGERAWEALPELDGSDVRETAERAMADQEPFETDFHSETLGAWVEIRGYPSASGLSVYVRDVTERVERERELERYETIVETVDDGIYVVDDDAEFVLVNDAYCELTGYSREELIGAHSSLVIGEELWQEAAARKAELGTNGETVSIEGNIVRPDGTTVLAESKNSRLSGADSGLVGVVRDVSERVEREHELERYETIVETVSDGVYVLDGDSHFVEVNDAYADIMGFEREQLIGSHASLVIGDEQVAELDRRTRELAERGERSDVAEVTVARPEGGEAFIESRFSPLWDADGDLGRVGVVRDVTERVERERDLERFRRMVETVDDGIYVLDGRSRFVEVNDAFCDLTGYSREELLGAHATVVTTAENVETGDRLAAGFDVRGGGVASVEASVVTKAGEEVPVENRLTGFDVDGGPGRIGVVRDVSARLRRESELRDRVRQQAAITELGRRALEEGDLDALFVEASETVADVLGNDYCKVLDLDDAGEELLLRQGVGWREGIVGEATVSASESKSQAAYTLAVDGPVIVGDLATDGRIDGPELLTSHDVVSGISTVIGTNDDPWGILGTHHTERREFSDHDAAFVQSVANILASAIDRHRREGTLVRQREEIAALNNVNEVVRRVSSAVIDQSTREEIERTVCERLAASESYRFAWIGEVDAESLTVRQRAMAGADGYLDGVTISVDPDDERSRGPTGRALRTGEVHTTSDVLEDYELEEWRDHAREWGFRSSAAIPIVHEGTVYGALNLYADRSQAFEGDEREVLAHLGEQIGHAIAAADRKQALMSDEVVELEYQVEDVLDSLGLDGGESGRIVLDHTVSVRDDEFVHFGHADEAGIRTLERITDAIPFYEDLVVSDDAGGDDEPRRFRVRVREPPVQSVVASLGGSIEEAVIDDGDYRVRLFLPPTADVRRLIDAMRESYPDARLLKRRQRPRPDRNETLDAETVTGSLTDRQRAALEAAFHAGYFEWPRESSGEDVAASLGVAAPTFHQHLRKAERKVFETVLPVAT